MGSVQGRLAAMNGIFFVILQATEYAYSPTQQSHDKFCVPIVGFPGLSYDNSLAFFLIF
jgi:hypothetical protein